MLTNLLKFPEIQPQIFNGRSLLARSGCHFGGAVGVDATTAGAEDAVGDTTSEGSAYTTARRRRKHNSSISLLFYVASREPDVGSQAKWES
jgi:hypothetical protein